MLFIYGYFKKPWLQNCVYVRTLILTPLKLNPCYNLTNINIESRTYVANDIS